MRPVGLFLFRCVPFALLSAVNLFVHRGSLGVAPAVKNRTRVRPGWSHHEITLGN